MATDIRGETREQTMQKGKKTVPPVQKPILAGSWHGKDAWRRGCKLMLSVLFVSVLYLFLCLLLTFDSLALRIVTAVLLVAAAGGYLYASGTAAGQTDAAYGEILYARRQEGRAIAPEDVERSFHPAKGFMIVLVGVSPYLLITLVFACMTSLSTYSLGVLPTWLTRYTRQSGIGDALAYYQTDAGMSVLSILRVAARSMTLPFINVAVKMGDVATLWAERLTPLWVTVAPLGYALGYRQGLKAREKINTGIAIGEKKKKRRARREHKARTQGHKPEQLI